MEILVSNKIILVLILLATISLYISFIFNSCVVTNISKAIPKWKLNPVVPNEIPPVHYTTSVRVVSLLEGNETDISPKYKFLKEQGLRPERQLPSALIIGVIIMGIAGAYKRDELVRMTPGYCR